MSTGTRLNWLAAIIIALLLANVYRLDGPSEIDAAQDVASAVADLGAEQATPRGASNTTRGN